MSLVDSVRSVLTNYANFSGRARRSEYWWFVLASLVVFTVLAGLGRASSIFLVLYGLVGLALIVPALAVVVRRLHDTDKPGWLAVLAFIPIADIVLLVFLVIDGTPGANRFGPSPKAGAPVGPAPAYQA